MQMHARDADQWAERAKIAENELAKEQAVSEKLRDNDRYAAIICKEIRNESKEWKQRAEAAEKALYAHHKAQMFEPCEACAEVSRDSARQADGD